MTKSLKLRVLSAAMAVTLTATTALTGVGTVFASDDKQSAGFENGSSKLDITQTGRYVSGMTNADGGVMEIVTYNTKTGFVYAVNGQSGCLTAIPIDKIENNKSVQQLEGNNIDIKSLVEAEGYKYGDMTSECNGTVILYTNDVHAAMDNYPALAAYRQQMINSGYKTYLVDAGDAIQGEIVGSMTDGESIVEIMNSVGFDFAAIGNHEFDYGMDRFKQLSGLTENDVQAKYEYLSANFIDLSTNTTVFEPYKVVETNGTKIAILGISTPETYTKSIPKYFQDKNGNFIYSFSEDKASTPENEFFDTIQSAIDKADKEADIVIALGHLGTDSGSQPYCSTDLIANTTGLDAFIDGHSHSTIPAETVNNKNGEPVVLTSTGTKFNSFGKMTISPEGTIETELVDPNTVTVDNPESVKYAYDKTETIVNDYRTQVEEFANVKIGVAEVPLYITDPATGNRMIRNRETNLGDFVSDAYRAATGADIAIANGGGIRADVMQGDVTRKNLMDVNTFKNQISVYEVTGQQILDALEWSARKPLNDDKTALTENGGFLHTSGLTYEINLTVEESPTVEDEKGSYLRTDDTKRRRVQNVMVNGEPIDPTKTYTLAGGSYTIQNGGDGYTMFAGCKVVVDGVGNDQDLLCQYLEENLEGVVRAEQYGNPYGEGRINIILSEEPEISEPEISEPETSEPETSEPETSKPEISEPETSEPETSEPEISKPETSEPETSEPETSKPVTDTSKPADTSTSSDNSNQVSNTGDNTNVTLLFVVLITSSAAIVVFKRKSKAKN